MKKKAKKKSPPKKTPTPKPVAAAVAATKGTPMRIALKALANEKYVCADDSITITYQGTHTAPASSRPLQANRDGIGQWETFELMMQDATGAWVPFAFPEPPTPVPPTPVPPTPVIDPITGIWPPPVGTQKVRPPDVATTDHIEVKRQLRWSLWVANSSDDESYWMNAIVLNPEPGHTPGWTADDYWYQKIAVGDGAGKGYVWPSK